MVLLLLVEVVWTKLVLGPQLSLLFVRRVSCGVTIMLLLLLFVVVAVVVWTLLEVLLSLLSVDRTVLWVMLSV